MVECELRKRRKYRQRDLVLIDTWWNVNRLRAMCQTTNGFGFNRYMVECELLLQMV